MICTNLSLVKDRIRRSRSLRLHIVIDLCERCGADMVIAESDGYFAGLEETANLKFCGACQREERQFRRPWTKLPVGEKARHIGLYEKEA